MVTLLRMIYIKSFKDTRQLFKNIDLSQVAKYQRD